MSPLPASGRAARKQRARRGPRAGAQRQREGLRAKLTTTKAALAAAVAEHHRTEAELRASEERFRLALEMTSDYAYAIRIEPDGRPVVEWRTGAFTRILGYSEEEIEALGGGWTLVHPEDRPLALQRVSNLVSGRSDVSDFRIITKSGDVRWLREHGRPVWDAPQERVVRIYAAAQDITEAKRAEQQAHLLQTIALSISEARDLESALRFALRTVCEITGWAIGQAWLPRADGSVLECSAAWYGAPGLELFRAISQAVTFPPGVGLPGRAWSTHEPLWLPDVQVDSNFPRVPVARKVGLRSALGIPVVADQQVIAVLEFFLTEVRQEDESLVALISAVAAQLGSAIRRKQTEVALHESELKFRSLAQSATDAVVSADSSGRIIFWNRGAEAMFGYREQEVLGKPLTVLMPERYREAHLKGLARVTATGTSIVAGRTVELHGLTSDGTEFPLELSLSVWETAAGLFFSGIIRDTTERKRAEAALRYRLELEKLISTISTNFINLAPAEIDHEITAALEAIGTFAGVHRGCTFQFSEDGSTMTNTHEWCAPGVAPQIGYWKDAPTRAFSWWVDQLRRGETVHVPEFAALPAEALQELRERALPSIPHLRSAILVPMVYGKAVVGFFGFASLWTERKWADEDIALLRMFGEIVVNALERKRAQLALERERTLLARRVEERTADLSAANAELARAARLKDEFLASMSHELRTPLNSILGMSEALQEHVYGPLNEKQLKSLQSVSESGQHLLSLINDILDLSKIDADKLELEIGPVNVETVCEASLRLVREAAQKKRLMVSCAIDSVVETVQADPRRLKQILINLLSNAVKFTPEGGTIGLEVSGDATRHAVRFTVWDTGIGIAREDIPHLFHTFVQLDSALSRQYAGTGLGLSLVQRMAELHGGSVAVESEPGRGSRFTVSLPWDEATAHGDGPEGAMSEPSINHAFIIEDSRSAADQIARYLHELGAQVVIHQHAAGAVERVLEIRPDVIVLDILLPDGSGWDVLRDLKADLRTRDIPVLVLSVLDERSQGLALGAAEYLVKPTLREQFRAALRRILPPRAGPTALVVAPIARPVDAPLILLAEDNEMTIRTLTDSLQAKGYRLIVARNGSEAIARAEESRPQVILMDIQMPGMDGLEATRRIRANALLHATPIVAMTALAMTGDRERCFAAGVDEYLSKPVSLKGLVAAIEAQLQRTRELGPS